MQSNLSKKEYIATALMQGLIEKYTLERPEDQEILSKLAVELAETLILELEKDKFNNENQAKKKFSKK
jgi:hypothetical protein